MVSPLSRLCLPVRCNMVTGYAKMRLLTIRKCFVSLTLLSATYLLYSNYAKFIFPGTKHNNQTRQNNHSRSELGAMPIGNQLKIGGDNYPPSHGRSDGNQGTYKDGELNSIKHFNYYPLAIDIKELVTKIRQGYETNIKPINTHPFEFLISSSEKCHATESVFITFLVKTRPDAFLVRLAIRETWGREMSVPTKTIKTVFLIGLPEHDFLLKLLEVEQEQYGDLVQENFIDSYYNNTIKFIMGFKWAKTYCKQAKYVVFSDDDMMIIPKNLVQYLEKGEVKRVEKLYMGLALKDPPPVRGRRDKWYISVKEYPFDLFPDYVTTGTLIMNMNSVIDFYIAAEYIKMINFDDVYGGIIAKKLGVAPLKNKNIYGVRKDYDSALYNTLIATHGGFKPHELRNIWKKVMKDL